MLDATPFLRFYARRRLAALARQDGAAAQRRQLLSLIGRARETLFGRAHGFAQIRDVADYQARVPLRRYEQFWSEYWQPRFPVLDNVSWPGRIPYFARSSGTSSGATKHIPVSENMMGANRRAAIDLLVHHVQHRPASRVLAGRNFVLGGSTALETLAPGVAAGDLSGIAAASVPFWAQPYYFPRGALARVTDWEEKTAALARRSLAENIRSISGTPSWLLLFFERLRAESPQAGESLNSLYPDLELITHGGVAFAPYRDRFVRLLEGSHAETREVYPASEGFVALADRAPGEGLRMLTDNGLFFELVPLEELEADKPTRHWLGNAETGVNYALVVSSCAGLWSYIVGDTVRLIGLRPARLLVTGRTAYNLSAFGEHLIAEEIDTAIGAAAASIGAAVTDYTVGPVYPAERSGYHLYLVEFSDSPDAGGLSRFAAALDKKLSALNIDYAEHRAGNFGMDPPRVIAVSRGGFAAWMKARGKLGGQNKVPRVISDETAFKAMVRALAGEAARGD
jgi:GH3 auxin-responsive promoter